MSFTTAESEACQVLVELAWEEDLGPRGSRRKTHGDSTTSALIPADCCGRAAFVARAPGVVAGLPAVNLALSTLGSSALKMQFLVEDGARVQAGERLAIVSGPMQGILIGERTALNFLRRLSGIATLTRRFVDAVAGLKAVILDTRKTTPGWRLLEKYAVRCGGGQNHRMGLYDGILIKDNHLAALGEGGVAVKRAIERTRKMTPGTVPIEVEVESFEQLDAALSERPAIILLDNMTAEQMREAVRRRDAVASGVQLEASGGITLDTVRGIAETGVDRISVGALTHSAPALDIGLDYFPDR